MAEDPGGGPPATDEEARFRYTASALAREALAQLGPERGFVRTSIDLLVRPGEMLRSCLQTGAKGRYLGPIPFLLLVVGVWWFVWMRFPPPFLSDLEPADAPGPGFELLIEYGGPLLSSLTIIPLALGTRLILARWGLSFVEHLVANAYVWANANFLVLLTYPLLFSAWGYVVMGLVNTLVVFAYHPFAFAQLGDRGFPRDFPRAWLATAVGSTLLALPLLLLIALTVAMGL